MIVFANVDFCLSQVMCIKKKNIKLNIQNIAKEAKSNTKWMHFSFEFKFESMGILMSFHYAPIYLILHQLFCPAANFCLLFRHLPHYKTVPIYKEKKRNIKSHKEKKRWEGWIKKRRKIRKDRMFCLHAVSLEDLQKSQHPGLWWYWRENDSNTYHYQVTKKSRS